MNRRLLVAGAIALLSAGGCACPNIRFDPPRSAREAVERINSNFAALDQPLVCKDATVSFSFHDEHGLPHVFPWYPARILFDAPRCLYFDIRHTLGGTVAHVGSNDDRYWFWIDIDAENQKLWWGTWEALERREARRLAVPPDQLLAVLLFQPIPVQLRDGPPPLIYENNGDRVLVFTRPDALGWPYVAREIVLTPETDYMPARITDYEPSGEQVMTAVLSRYSAIDDTGPDGPRTPREYRIKWPVGRAALDLDLSRVGYRTSDVPCDFPEEWQGTTDYLDQLPPRDTEPEYTVEALHDS